MYFRPQQFNVRTLRDDMGVGWGGLSLGVDMVSMMYFLDQAFGYMYSCEYVIVTVGRMTKIRGRSDVR